MFRQPFPTYGSRSVRYSPDQVAARIVSEYSHQVRLLKDRTNMPRSAVIPDSIILAKFSTTEDHRRLITLGTSTDGKVAPWQSPHTPSPLGNYCAHFYAMRLDLTLPLFRSSLQLGVNYSVPPNRNPLHGTGQTPLQITQRLHRDKPELIRAMADAATAGPPVVVIDQPMLVSSLPNVARLQVRHHQARLPFG